MNEKKKLNEKYEVGLMIVSIVIILALMIGMNKSVSKIVSVP